MARKSLKLLLYISLLLQSEPNTVPNPYSRKHGTFRPKLLSLVESNPAPQIASTTRTAYAELSTLHHPKLKPAYTKDDRPNPRATALKKLSELKGIGPATASLLMSVFDPDGVPFFSDVSTFSNSV
jgi:predicted flap endonuclease-1-like 5' DNA nuclease